MTEKSDYTKASDKLFEIQKLVAQATFDFHVGYSEKAIEKIEKVKKLLTEAKSLIAADKGLRAKKAKKFLSTVRKSTKQKSHGRSHSGAKTSGKKKS
jgi:hypothetical protein